MEEEAAVRGVIEELYTLPLPTLAIPPVPLVLLVPLIVGVAVALVEVVPLGCCVSASRIHACFNPSSGVILSFASHRRQPSKKSKNNLQKMNKVRNRN